MTTTVVGAAIISALLVAKKAVLAHSPASSSTPSVAPASKSNGTSSCSNNSNTPIKILGDDTMADCIEASLASARDASLESLLKDARRSARTCICEGGEIVVQQILRCTSCGHTCCMKCVGRPQHHYGPPEDRAERLAPRDFKRNQKSAIPTRVKVVGLKEGVLASVGGDHLKQHKASGELWSKLCAMLCALEGVEFRFQSWIRGIVWTALYKSENGARLELLLDSREPRWQLLLPPVLGKRSPLHEAIARPIARMRVTSSNEGVSTVLGGTWEFCVPVLRPIKATLHGQGALVDTFEASIGLLEHEGKKRWSQWRVEIEPSDDSTVEEEEVMFDVDISGTYTLLENCGGPMGSLHKKVGVDGTEMYFFLEEARTGYKDQDRFVFASSGRRLVYLEQRGEVAALSAGWRPSDTEKQTVTCSSSGRWVPAPTEVRLVVSGDALLKLSSPAAYLKLEVNRDSCLQAVEVLRCLVALRPDEPLCPLTDTTPARNSWVTLPLQRSAATFETLTWLTERFQFPSQLLAWYPAGTTSHSQHCNRCSPPWPKITWAKNSKGQIEPFEHPRDAAAFEQALKNRPPIFLVQLRHNTPNDTKATGEMRICVNVAALLHRAQGCLPAPRATNDDELTLSWRVTEHHFVEMDLEPLRLVSNRADKPHSQPPDFKLLLRPEQQRSLEWMIRQEECEEPFLEEEVEEAVLHKLGWRAEAKVQRAVVARGGIVADQVGYGKTAISLGLINCDILKARAEIQSPKKDPCDLVHGRIPTRATLVVAPAHLMKQWPSELAKFCGSSLKAVSIQTMTDLNKKTIRDIMQADIVFVAVTVFRGGTYIYKDTPNTPKLTLLYPHFYSTLPQPSMCLRGRIKATACQSGEDVRECV